MLEEILDAKLAPLQDSPNSLNAHYETLLRKVNEQGNIMKKLSAENSKAEIAFSCDELFVITFSFLTRRLRNKQ